VIAWLNPVSGLSGDMLLGALLDLGAARPAVIDAVASTGITGWNLSTADVHRGGIRATHARVEVTDTAASRPASVLLELAARARPAPVAQVAVQAIQALAEVEAGIHGVPTADVHLHELGGVDTIVDVVGVAAAVHALGITELWSSALGLGVGTTSSAHGLIPVPAPATLALLRDVPVRGIEVGFETVTPTGAALLKALGCRYGPPPAMTVRATGYGAGTRDTPGRPNVLGVSMGTAPSALGASPAASLASSADSSAVPSTVEVMTVLETTVDDVTGEVLGHLTEVLLGAGAVDVWIAAVTGKKSRPAHIVTALVEPGAATRVEHTMLRETGSLGVRSHDVSRRALDRSSAEVIVAGHPVRMKVGPYRAKPEYDDLVDVAALTGRSLREVAELAAQAWSAQTTESPPPEGGYTQQT
jgi:pyridinium-3,5-bisthiocarboxylic acid mononucleotide nickel chelatase